LTYKSVLLLLLLLVLLLLMGMFVYRLVLVMLT